MASCPPAETPNFPHRPPILGNAAPGMSGAARSWPVLVRAPLFPRAGEPLQRVTTGLCHVMPVGTARIGQGTASAARVVQGDALRAGWDERGNTEAGDRGPFRAAYPGSGPLATNSGSFGYAEADMSAIAAALAVSIRVSDRVERASGPDLPTVACSSAAADCATSATQDVISSTIWG